MPEPRFGAHHNLSARPRGGSFQSRATAVLHSWRAETIESLAVFRTAPFPRETAPGIGAVRVSQPI